MYLSQLLCKQRVAAIVAQRELIKRIYHLSPVNVIHIFADVATLHYVIPGHEEHRHYMLADPTQKTFTDGLK